MIDVMLRFTRKTLILKDNYIIIKLQAVVVIKMFPPIPTGSNIQTI